ncbi:MAG: glycerate dehydrogenase [Verrucomicrobia bacterium]|nr:MAG: glycerate dehydrogenase [Verrucomicrobiota bacterium]
MNIVVLDGFTLNPGDLSWDELKSLGPCKIYDRSAPSEISPRAAKAEILLTNKILLTRAQIESLPRLKYIGITATGTNVVDLTAAQERGVVVTNVPAYGTQSVAQTTIALLLELTQHSGDHGQRVRAGEWSRKPDWCFWDHPLIELDGLTLGIIGFGRIGRAVGKLGAAFGMKVIVCLDKPKPLPMWARRVNLKTVFRQSDVLSLHCPLTPKTEKLVNAERLSWMKSTAFLINTSRGMLIDEAALAAALNAGCLAGAGLDVLSVEPPPADHPLLAAKNCIITPHLAWATRAARARLMNIAVENVRSFLRGRPRNVIQSL